MLQPLIAFMKRKVSQLKSLPKANKRPPARMVQMSFDERYVTRDEWREAIAQARSLCTK